MAQRGLYTGVPTQEPSGPPANDYQRIDAEPAAFGGQIGQATEKLGGTLDKAGDQTAELAKQFQSMQNATDALNATTSASKETGDLEAQFRQLKGQDATKALPDFQAKVQALQDRYANGMTNPTAKLAFLRDFKSYADRTMITMGIHAGDQAEKAHLGALNGALLEAQSRMVRSAGVYGTEPDIHEIVSLVSQLGQAQGWEKPQVDATIQQHVGSAMHQIVDAQIAATDPNSFNRTERAQQTFDKLLHSNIPGTDLPMLDGRSIDAISTKLTNTRYQDQNREQAALLKQQAAEERNAVHWRVHLGKVLDNATAMIDRGFAPTDLPSDREIVNAFPRNPEAAADFQEKVQTLRTIGSFATTLADATPEQVADLRRSAAPDPTHQENFSQKAKISSALDAALSRRSKALTDDPAGYVLGTHPELVTQFQASQKDPTIFGAYAQAALATQAALGVPEGDRGVIPAAAAQSMAAQIMGDPETAPARIKQLQQQYGSFWPNVWRDLSTVKGGLPVAYQAVGTIGDETQAALLAKGLAEQGKSGKNLADLLPPHAKGGATGIDESIKSNDQIHKLFRSIGDSGGGADLQSQLMGAVKTLAYANVVYAGKDAGSAVADAVKAFTGNFTFMPQGNARVPQERYADVSANAQMMIAGLGEAKLLVPSAYGKPGGPKAEEYARLIQSSPYWITAPSGDALWLMDAPPPVGRIVRGVEGNPVAVPFGLGPPAASPVPPPWITGQQ